MSKDQSEGGTCIGIIANPVSARDIRRIVANASNLQTSERVSIVLRVLSTLASVGVKRVLMMPDKGGISSMLLRSLKRDKGPRHRYPEVEFVDIPVTSTVHDTFAATRKMQHTGVRAIIVLGGDGTHRAVVRELLEGTRRGANAVPIAGLSTGTNNAFPEMREPTVAALAVGLYAVGKIAPVEALSQNKILEISIAGKRRDIAIVDAVIASDRFIGSRALWKTESLSAVYLAFADPQVIGLSAIGGLLHPVGRKEAGGLAVYLSRNASECRLYLKAPIAPGMVSEVGIADWKSMSGDEEFTVALESGVVALDGEREMTFDEGEKVLVVLRENAFQTVDVERCMHLAARTGIFRQSTAIS
jgi:predicted polyphosphate/ATP-dependent NAD kinase